MIHWGDRPTRGLPLDRHNGKLSAVCVSITGSFTSQSSAFLQAPFCYSYRTTWSGFRLGDRTETDAFPVVKVGSDGVWRPVCDDGWNDLTAKGSTLL